MSQIKCSVRSLLLAVSCFTAVTQAAENSLQLYMDTKTKQIFAEPGPNRVFMGTFQPVNDQQQSVQTMPTPVEQTSPASLSNLDERLVKNEQEIAQLRDMNAQLASRKSWTDSLQIKGYVQTRYTEMIGGDEGINLWSDRSVGDDRSLSDADKNFLIRRARLVFSGDAGDHLSFYIQPDLASSSGSTGNVLQMRDTYGDIYLVKDRVHCFCVGQSKVPYGFENLQSSSNRLTLDRNDALNSAVRDERDLGVFYYYTPESVQALFSEISSLGLKHSGNYGMFGLGVYNGQGANRGDRNDTLHTVARLTYPWKFDDGQFFEAGVQAYTGKYVPTVGAFRGLGDVPAVGVIAEDERSGYTDERVGVSAIWYPQPFGIQAEWNWGKTPGLNMATNIIEERSLDGGYVQAMFMTTNGYGTFIPFLKWQYFDGANKAETNAPINKVNDIELGLEWQVSKALELTAVYHRMDRNNLVTGNRSGRVDYEHFDADALRIQLQFNY